MSQTSVRFLSPVWPGETLIVSAWKDGDTIVFTIEVKDRPKKTVAAKGYIYLKPKAEAKL